MQPVRWGVLGVATHFIRRVAGPLGRSTRMEMWAIASRSAEKARSTAGSLGIPVSYGSYEDLLKDELIEAVYIPLPNHLHLEWVRRCADAGKHVLCEKPLGLNAAQAREAVDYARQRGVLLMEAFMYRFHPQWRRVHELIRAGELGRIHAVHVLYAYNNPDPQNIRNRPEAGGGGLLDIGCYAVSAARFVLQREPRRASCLLTRDPGFGTDVLTSGVLEFDGPGSGDGATGEEAGARALFTVGTRSFPAQRVDILGSTGRIAVHLPFNMYPDVPARLTVTTSVGERELALGPEDQYGLEFDAFSLAIREGREAPVPPEDAVSNMKALDALSRSAQAGGWETV